MSARLRAILVSLGLCLPACLELGGSATSATTTTGPAFDTYGCFRNIAGRHGSALATDTDTTTSSGDPEVFTTGTTAPEDYEAMDACAIALACEQVSHEAGEGANRHDTDYYLAEELCLLEGLRDGRPGAYRTEVTTYWSNGGRTDTHILHISIERDVTIVHHRRSRASVPNAVEFIDEYSTARSCKLEDSVFFIDCLENYDAFGHIYDCLNPEKWVRACYDAEPWCPCDPEGT